MKKKTGLIIIISVALAVVIGVTSIFIFTGKTENKKDSIVIMTDALSGLFNPFYATSGADQGVIGLTQIGMLTTNEKGDTVAGDDQPTVVKAFDQKYDSAKKETVYTFVIKNGLKFSDGEPLTMNDVLFNMYEYLDPVYTGSSTMYSIKIKGLAKYRLQQNISGDDDAESSISAAADNRAWLRIYELVDIFTTNGKQGQNSYSATESQMKGYIANWGISNGYKNAVASDAEQATMTDDNYKAQLLEDYAFALKTFKEELESDYQAASESFDTTTETSVYKEWASFLSSDVTKFLVYEGYITPEYELIQGKKNKNKITKWNGTNLLDAITTKEQAINKVYNDNVTTSLDAVLTGWGTSRTLLTAYSARAKEILLKVNVNEDGTLEYPNIEGIVSVGHNTNLTAVTVNGTTYNVAREHNDNGTPKNANEYDVLQITVEGTDPKAIYNFGFTVAPAHYYAEGGTYSESYGANKGKSTTTIDIANNMFGVCWSSSDFQSKVIQSQKHVEVPVGAGAFAATDKDDNDNPTGANFVNSNIVYYKANKNFMFPVKAEKLRMQVVSSSNAIDKLESGEVDYITPQFTKANSDRLNELAKKGFVQLDSWQLGYGYIGVNAGKVPNVFIRRAIMSAMQTSLSLEYYAPGTCKNIDWPMSMESWAYPYEDDGETSKQNGHPYTQWTGESAARQKIQENMDYAGVSAGDSQLKITFTIAGASITEHPTYPVFKQAAEILNSMGWDIEVKADSQALTKLSTGSLSVWAAAWGSTIDPDMYQVYHKNSTATSVYSWGYREIKSDTTNYSYEWSIINQMSEIIDDARSITDKQARTAMYEQAMGYVLDLAVEMPVYQRKTLYAYNGNTLTGLGSEVNPYTSPLEKIWEISLK